MFSILREIIEFQDDFMMAERALSKHSEST